MQSSIKIELQDVMSCKALSKFTPEEKQKFGKYLEFHSGPWVSPLGKLFLVLLPSIPWDTEPQATAQWPLAKEGGTSDHYNSD